jgi:tRNA threonylcarbamoyladenosine biosynthesis protein TsaE
MGNQLEILSPSAVFTQQIGYTLGTLLQAGDVLCLSGELGAGKTTFAIGLGQGWGAATPLTSPTFVIVRQYGRLQDQQILYHLDAYRISSAGDAETLGLEDILAPENVILIEWAENLQDDLPSDCLWITLEDAGLDERNIQFEPMGARAQSLLISLRDRL